VLACALAVVATAVWAWLVRWRVGRHRTALWKSLVLPAGGAAWCWLLLMTLWLPLLNYAQSYTALVRQTVSQMQPQGCAHVLGLGHGTLAAYQYYGGLSLQPMQAPAQCPWLLAAPRDGMEVPGAISTSEWVLQAPVRHPAMATRRCWCSDANKLCVALLGRRRAHPARRKVNRTPEPLPGVLSINSSAPWRCDTCLTMARPKPVPPVSRERLRSTR